jgi:ABC-type multidrug transport system ATPase subunit
MVAMQLAEQQSETSRPGQDEAAVRLDGVSKVYGGFAALRNLSLEFAAGSCTMILGENGAGKSTLLRLAAGLIAPTHGVVEVFGSRPGESRERIAYMSHAAMLYDELSAIENLKYFGSLNCDGACACVGSPEMALRAVGLDPKLSRPVGQYSQGMRQRTALARALQADPELLLLDEPFSNLDVASAQHMVELLADFRTWPVSARPDGGVGKRTIVFTTHQAHLGTPIADETLTMQDGRIVSRVSGEKTGDAQA